MIETSRAVTDRPEQKEYPRQGKNKRLLQAAIMVRMQ
jgi:hypothetical protein